MKTSFCKRLFNILFVLVFTLLLAVSVMAESYTATTMRLLRYEGSVEIVDESGKPSLVMENIRFNSGQSLHTGSASSASVGMDSTKIVTLDENTKVKFTKKSKEMQLSLSEGSFFLDVSEKLGGDESLDIKTSTMTVGIRGTIVVASTYPLEEYQKRLSEKTADGRTAAEQAANGQAASNQAVAAEDTSLSALEETILQASDAGKGGLVSVIGVLEGKVEMDYQDENGKNVKLNVSGGQKATLLDSDENGRADVTPEINKVNPDDIFDAAIKEIQESTELQNRLKDSGLDFPGTTDDLSSNPADGSWTYTGRVTVIAQSASKMYDGQPLTRRSDVLVQGLPSGFTFDAAAGGTLTDAGAGDNPVRNFAIYNQKGENVTSHFTNIDKVSGKLIIDPAPLTAWSGSASKVYDGTPLTSTETKLTFSPGYQKMIYGSKNLSYVITGRESASNSRSTTGNTTGNASGTNSGAASSSGQDRQSGQTGQTEQAAQDGQTPQTGQTAQDGQTAQPAGLADSQTLYGICGTVLVHGSNPLTEEIKEIYLAAGQKLTVHLSDKDQETSIEYIIETITEDEIPEDILRIYADNPEILTQACAETGWDAEKLNKRIQTLPPLDNKSSDVNGVKMDSQSADKLMEDCTNVRITIDTEGTNYNNRALNKEEAHYTPMKADSSIKIITNASITDVGTIPNSFTIDWGSANKDNYKLSEEYGTLTVTPASAVVKTGSAEKVYDGTPLTNSEASISGLVHGETAKVTATGSITNVGSKSNSYSIDWGSANEKNYDVSSQTGTLRVTGNDTQISIKVSVSGKTYDGKPLEIDTIVTSGDSAETASKKQVVAAGDSAETTIALKKKTVTVSDVSNSSNDSGIAAKAAQDETTNTVKVEGLPSGFTFKAHITGSRTDAGTGDLTIESYQILDEDGTDVTDQFSNVEIVESTLTIDPAPASVTTGSASKLYDGTPLTSSEASVSGIVDADKDAVKVTATGSITEIGTAENTYTIDWGTAKSSNYTLSETLGTLEVTQNDTEVTFTAPSDSKTYDGTPLQAGEVTVTGLPEGFTYTAAASGSQTDAGSSETAVDSYKILNADGNDVTAGFSNIKTVKGTLTVNPAAVTITTESASKQYDGKPLNGTVSVSGIPDAEKEKIKVTATGSITEIGTAENTYTIDWGDAKSSNYTVSETIGTLEVTKNNNEITFTSASAEKTYDGTPLSAPTVTVEGLPEGFTYVCSAGNTFSVVDAGTYSNMFDDMEYSITDEEGHELVGWRYVVIKNADGKDVTDNFSNLKFVEGTLTIKALDVIFEMNSYDTEFNGQKVLPDGFNATYGDGSEVDKEYETMEVDEFDCPVHLTCAYRLTGGGEIQIDVDGYSDAGTYDYEPVKTFLAGTESNYNVSFTNTGFTIAPLTVNLTVKDGSGVYDEAYHGAELTGAGCGDETATVTSISDTEWLLAGYTIFPSETITVRIEGGGIEAGEYPLTYSYSFGNNDPDNYDIVTPSLDKIVVEALAITIDLQSPEFDYDGREHGSVPELKYENGPNKGESPTVSTMMSNDTGDCKGEYILFDDVMMTVQTGGNGPDAGTHTLSCIYSFTDGVDSNNYKVDITGDTLTINKITAVVTTGSATGPSGTMYPVTNDEASITGLAETDIEYVTITATGKQSVTGSSTNTYSIKWGTDDHPVNKENYIIEEHLGTLTMYNAAITPPSDYAVPSNNNKAGNPAETGSDPKKDTAPGNDDQEAAPGNDDQDAAPENDDQDASSGNDDQEAAPENDEKDAAGNNDENSTAGQSGDESDQTDQGADQTDKPAGEKEANDSKVNQPDQASEGDERTDSEADKQDQASENKDSKPDQSDKASDNSEKAKNDETSQESTRKAVETNSVKTESTASKKTEKAEKAETQKSESSEKKDTGKDSSGDAAPAEVQSDTLIKDQKDSEE